MPRVFTPSGSAGLDRASQIEHDSWWMIEQADDDRGNRGTTMRVAEAS